MIARTLGIVDDVKASTSDQPALLRAGAARTDSHTPAGLRVAGESSPSASEGSPPAGHAHVRHHASPAHRTQSTEMSSGQGEMKPQAFFAGDEDLQLSAIGVFSPSPSQPSSPVLPTDKLSGEGGVIRTGDVREPREEDVVLRRRLQGTQGQDR